MKNIKQTHSNQTGLVSFFVVVIIMIVLSLIVLAFAQLVRREQQQTLDRQLSTQAFYAAESGVNDAVDVLTGPNAPNSWSDDCDGFINAANSAGASLDPVLDGNISYSCLLVDNTPPELPFSDVPVGQSISVPIQPEGGDMTHLEITWDDAETAGLPADCSESDTDNTFPGRLDANSSEGNCRVGSLRVELVPFGGTKNRDQLIRERFIGYFMPGALIDSNGAIVRTFNQGSNNNQGVKRVGGCTGASSTPPCTVRITGLPSDDLYYLRIRSLYRPTSVTVRAFDGSNSVNLVGAHALIDVTGRAADVLRRIKVAWPLDNGGQPSPEFALQSRGALCKRFGIAPHVPRNLSLVNVSQNFDGIAYPECDPLTQ